MEIIKTKKESKLVVTLKGQLDSTTSKELETSLKDEIGAVKDIEFDFKKLDYISSAGLRLLLSYSKALGGKVHIVVKNSNDVLKEIFKVTSFATFATIQ